MTASIDPTHESSRAVPSETSAKLDTNVRAEGGCAVLAVRGEVDAATGDRFRSALLEAQRSSHVVVDLSAVTFMDSVGVNALVGAYHRMPAGGELRVVGLRPNIRRVFEITGLLALFGVDASDDYARLDRLLTGHLGEDQGEGVEDQDHLRSIQLLANTGLTGLDVRARCAGRQAPRWSVSSRTAG
jgi:anti-anti-sigma factor